MENKQDFIGSRAEGETASEHAEREARWKEDHACTICGDFNCDGTCADHERDNEFEYEEE